MAVLLAVDGGVDLDDLVIPLGKLGDLHGGAVGDLLVQAEQQLLPQDLRHHLALRLIGDHVLWEELGPLGQKPVQYVQQLLHPLAGPGRDRDHGGELMGLPVGLDDLQQLLLVLQGVHLVDDQHRGAAQGLDAGDELRLRAADVGDGLHQQHDRVHVGHALLHHVHHVVPQAGACLVQARRIQKDELALPPVQNGADPVPGGLGLVGDDGHLLPHQGIGQGGLAHVGAAYNRDHSRFFDGHSVCSSTFFSGGVSTFRLMIRSPLQ